jgi:hypothetical protein
VFDCAIAAEMTAPVPGSASLNAGIICALFASGFAHDATAQSSPLFDGTLLPSSAFIASGFAEQTLAAPFRKCLESLQHLQQL